MFKGETEVLFEFGEGGLAIQGRRTVVVMHCGQIVLASRIVDDFGDDVIEGHQPDRASELIDHEGRVDSLVLESFEQDIGVGVASNRWELTNQRRKVERLVRLADPNEVLYVQQADHMVEVVTKDRVARDARSHNSLRNIGARGIVRDGFDVGPRGHQFFRGQLFKFEDVVDDLAL